MHATHPKINKTVALAGSTGLVGSFCLDLLLENPNVTKVHILVRRLLLRKDDKLTQHTIDFSDLDSSLLPDLKLDAVFCCLGTTRREAGSAEAFKKVDFEYVLALARWGMSRGASQFLVVSSMGANQNSAALYPQTKGLMEHEVSQLGYPTVHIFRPSLLVGPRKKPRWVETLAEGVLQALNPVLQGSLKHYRSIQAKTVAHAMLHCALEPGQGTHIYLSNEVQKLGATTTL